jgi:hypothetical protein
MKTLALSCLNDYFFCCLKVVETHPEARDPEDLEEKNFKSCANLSALKISGKTVPACTWVLVPGT